MYRQTGNKEDSLDLTQEIFISVLRSIKTYRADKASFRTWLYRIATNKIIDQRRKQHPEFLDIEHIRLPDEMDTEGMVYSSKAGRSVFRYKLWAGFLTSTICFFLIAAVTLIAYFSFFDYSQLWNCNVSNGFNYISDLAGIMQLALLQAPLPNRASAHSFTLRFHDTADRNDTGPYTA